MSEEFTPTDKFPANSGGSFIKGEDGKRMLVIPPTGERPCKCRPETAEAKSSVESAAPAVVPDVPAAPGLTLDSFEE